ncbi:hypothetical protein J9253_06025 [Thiothrix litoralis]|uniref:Uncharacterized protein n=1 Tax=Thiothrix litoralis TaxID=2891210 RepID=A0ABX7X2Y3_9GAMM|nr:hypothetical protein [Thiothrix litoralis]QTR47490.1 hypothetical protein J9253_06025 [Thiothrix litoralis]
MTTKQQQQLELEESETEDGEPCYRLAISEEDSVWLDGDGNEVTEYLSV